MLETLQQNKPHIDTRAMYLIRVLGDLDAVWLSYFDDISIVVSIPYGKNAVSTLCTRNADQATVLGILNSLYQYGYLLISMQILAVA